MKFILFCLIWFCVLAIVVFHILTFSVCYGSNKRGGISWLVQDVNLRNARSLVSLVLNFVVLSFVLILLNNIVLTNLYCLIFKFLKLRMLIIIVFQTQNKCFVGIDYIIYYVGCGVRYSQGKSLFFKFKPLLYGWMSYYLWFPILTE